MDWLASLAIAWWAVAASYAPSSETGADGKAQPPRLHHGAVIAENLDRSIAFYEQVFGLRVKVRWTSMQLEANDGADTLPLAGAWLEDPEGRVIELLDNANPAERPDEQEPINHIGFQVSDVPAMYKKALAAGAKSDTPPTRITAGELKAEIAFVRGLDGEKIEMFRIMAG